MNKNLSSLTRVGFEPTWNLIHRDLNTQRDIVCPGALDHSAILPYVTLLVEVRRNF